MCGIALADGENAMIKFKQATAEDFRRIIEESIDESSEVETNDLAESVRVAFDIMDKKIVEFFDE